MPCSKNRALFASEYSEGKIHGHPLLDDLFDKLDPGRVESLLRIVLGNGFGQIFITDCNKTRMQSMVDRLAEEKAYFEVKSGVFTPLSI